MTELTNGVRVTGVLTPTDTGDSFPTHDAQYGRGGHRTCATFAERNAITTERRTEGMIVFVVADQNYYKLKAPAWNGTDSDWERWIVTGPIMGSVYEPAATEGQTVFNLPAWGLTSRAQLHVLRNGVLQYDTEWSFDIVNQRVTLTVAAKATDLFRFETSLGAVGASSVWVGNSQAILRFVEATDLPGFYDMTVEY